MKTGQQSVKYGHVMFIGPPGVGKTSLLHALMNKPLPEANSTIVADTKHIKPQWVDTSGHMHWREISEDDEITELATLARRVLPEMKESSTYYLQKAYAAAEKAREFFAPKTVPSTSQCQMNTPAKQEAMSTLSGVMEKVFAKMKELDRKDTKSGSYDLLHIWDCGGQPIFLDIIPAFLTSRTMFYLLFDASKDINRNVEILWNRKGQESTEGSMEMTTLDLLLQWVAMIHTSISKQANSEIPDYPRVTIVGSHADQLQDDTREMVCYQLDQKCSEKEFQDILEETVFVNNRTAGMGSGEDPAITQIRNDCQRFISKLEVNTPLSWILFRKVLKHIAGERPVISYSEAADVAAVCNIPLKALPSVLNFYHELGVFLFYSCVPGLCNKVVISPEWLVRQIGKLIHPSEEEVKSQPQRLRQILREEGVLDQLLYQKVWEKCKVISSEEMMGLLCVLLLAFPILEESQVRKQFLIPLLLPRTSIRGSEASSCIQSSTSLHIIFNTNYTPPGFFVRLIASLGKHRKCMKGSFHRNCITLFFGNVSIGKLDQITVSESLTNISVSVTRQVERVYYSFSSAVKEIHSILVESIEKVKQWFPFVTTQLAFVCTEDICRSFPDHYVVIEPDHVASSVVRCQRKSHHHFSKAEQHWITDPLQYYIVTDDNLRECSRLMKEGDLSVLATRLGIGEGEMASIRSRHKTTQGQARDMLRSWKENEESQSSMTTNELSDILKSCGFREASKCLKIVETSTQEERRSCEEMEEENTSLKEQVYSLQEEVSSLMNQLTDLMREKDSDKKAQREEISSLKKQLADAIEENKVLKSHNRKQGASVSEETSTSTEPIPTIHSPSSATPQQERSHRIDDRPTLPQILSFPSSKGKMNLPQRIGSSYNHFGVFLLNDAMGTRTEAFKTKSNNNPDHINYDIFREWLQGSGAQPVTWRTIVKVLRKIGLLEMADDIEKEF